MLAEPSAPVLDDPASDALAYVEFAPPDDLMEIVEGIAFMSIPAATPPRRWRLVPDARARLYLAHAATAPWVFLPAHTKPSDIDLPCTGLVGMVRFAPWATGIVNDGGDGWSPGWLSDAPENLPTPNSIEPAAWCRAVADWLRGALPSTAPDARVIRAWRLLASERDLDEAALARAVGTSARSLRRIVRAACGCTVRTARQLERLRAALKLLRRDLELSWSAAALRAGFYDQSHLNRAFAKWVGMAPGRFFSEGHHHMNDVFARQVRDMEGGLDVIARGRPRLRPVTRQRLPARDGRRSRTHADGSK